MKIDINLVDKLKLSYSRNRSYKLITLIEIKIMKKMCFDIVMSYGLHII